MSPGSVPDSLFLFLSFLLMGTPGGSSDGVPSFYSHTLFFKIFLLGLTQCFNWVILRVQVPASHSGAGWLFQVLFPFRIQLPDCELGKAAEMAHILGTLHSRGRPEKRSSLLAVDHPSFGYCGQLGSEPKDRKISLLSLLSSKKNK